MVYVKKGDNMHFMKPTNPDALGYNDSDHIDKGTTQELQCDITGAIINTLNFCCKKIDPDNTEYLNLVEEINFGIQHMAHVLNIKPWTWEDISQIGTFNGLEQEFIYTHTLPLGDKI